MINKLSENEQTVHIRISFLNSNHVAQVRALLVKDFVGLIVIAYLITVPVVWLAMYYWLQSYAYRTDISFLEFIMGGILILLIAMTIISFHTIKVAVTNPVKSLRSE